MAQAFALAHIGQGQPRLFHLEPPRYATPREEKRKM